MIRLGPPPMPSDAVPDLVKLVGRALAESAWRTCWWGGFWSGAACCLLAALALAVVVLALDALRRR